MSASFAIPDGLAPEVYPLAWLVGSWRGYGVLAYPSITEQPIVQETTFDHDGGPYLRCTRTTWAVDLGRSSSVPPDTRGTAGADLLATAEVWSTETSYWRPVPGQQADTGPAGVDPRTGAPVPRPTEVEVLVAQPSGHVGVYVGTVQGPRIELASDALVRTASSAEIASGTRMYGLVASELMWVEELAAFGEELQPYMSGRLSREEK